MRRRGEVISVVFTAAALLHAAGCATPVVLVHPVTKERVNCTAEAIRDTRAPSGVFGRTGHDVPRTDEIAPGARQADYEQQCAGRLKQEGYTCVSGCR
jgi:hypothetical protein